MNYGPILDITKKENRRKVILLFIYNVQEKCCGLLKDNEYNYILKITESIKQLIIPDHLKQVICMYYFDYEIKKFEGSFYVHCKIAKSY